MSEIEPYRYKGLPITPSIVEELIVSLANGRTLKRDDIVKLILDFHINSGGLRPEAQDFPRSVKKALSRMQERGEAINKTYGFWVIQKTDAPLKESVAIEEVVEVVNVSSHAVYGEGDYAVYCYYFPAYRELSKSQGKNTWPCKIGRTDRDPLLRVLSQSATALPEPPYIEFVIKTNNSSVVEAVIHAALHLRGRYMDDSPGTEWFDTTPDEILEILRFINPELVKF